MKNNYTRPEIAIDGVIDIHDGRHPVVELMLSDEIFVPNDIYLDTKGSRMSVITGPNMSGKSTLHETDCAYYSYGSDGLFLFLRHTQKFLWLTEFSLE